MEFQPFDPHREVRHYRTTMPHWRQEGCTYFVTYRLADSIPAQILRGWELEKAKWLTAHGVKMNAGDTWGDGFLKLSDSDKNDFIRHFSREFNDYLDRGKGACVLRDPEHANIVLEGWEFFDGKRYVLGDLIVMPNHVHLLVSPLSGHDLEDILLSRKRQSALAINKAISKTGHPLWQKHSYDHIVRNEAELVRFQKYNKENPKKAKLQEGEFLWRQAT